MALVVLHPGLRTTVQDRGRFGYREWGVPVGGAFDQAALALANALLGNPPDAAALELTLVGGTYRAEVPLAIALAGAPMEAAMEAADGTRRPLHIPQTATLYAGETLILGGTPRGARTYLAVRGGWQTPPVLGSRSSEMPLKAGDRLPAAPGTTPVRRPAEAWPGMEADGPIRILDGPDAALIDPRLWETALFRVAPKSDRMGLRLVGTALDLASDPERVSTPVAPGAVQVAGGQPILLGPACGTMGGYPHVAHVISADLDRLAQLRPGDEVRLQRVEWDEARHLDRQHRRCLAERVLRTIALTRGESWGEISPQRAQRIQREDREKEKQ
ncbi:MAG: biotin-dependent carboxyltransferase family protein [Isosphaeraceae bacterium]|nr:biotin-dependent carboxyltransferase family protein [Isosphaeraceae bacterium]